MATPLTSLRVRHVRLNTLLSTVGQSTEVDFNIAFGQAIEIHAVHALLLIGATTATRQTTDALLDLDGPALDGNTLVTEALFDARRVLESCIANFGTGSDALTSGGAISRVKQETVYDEPILTARNPGVAGLALISTGDVVFDIHYKLVAVTDAEQLLLFALGRG